MSIALKWRQLSLCGARCIFTSLKPQDCFARCISIFLNNNCATSASFILYWSNEHFAKWPAGVAMNDEHYDFLLRLWPNKMYTLCSSKIKGMVSLIYVCMYHCEPPRQNVCIVSQICLILVSNCFKRSQFYLKHVSDKCLNVVSILDLFDIWDTINSSLGDWKGILADNIVKYRFSFFYIF